MNIIVAVDTNFAIGYKNNLLYDIPEDRKHFKALTINKTVVMGRKTFESLPSKKPLPNRRNIIITRNKNFSANGFEIFYSIEKFLEYAKKSLNSDDIFIIGGEEIYKEFLPMCKYIYLTEIYPDVLAKADSFFPAVTFEVVDKSEFISFDKGKFRYVTLKNKAL